MRDFFQRQDDARRISGQLAAVLAGAMVGTVACTALMLAALATILALVQVTATTSFEVDAHYWVEVFINRLLGAGVLVGGIVGGVAIYRTLQSLDAGGVEIARQMGGAMVPTIEPDPEYRQLINIVEELSIVTGVTSPKICVLNEETSINAFAVGVEPKDTVVGVTRGALEQLDRGQLQGMLAHEFSHIVNRDVCINSQTLGVLQGIESVAWASSYFRRMGVSSGVQGSMLATVIGWALWPVGQIGVFFGAMAKMALNRQRELLADAAAVQFTRDPESLSSTLKLIAGQRLVGMASPTARMANHLFFTQGLPLEGSLFDSHPPLEMRIRRLDPEWDGVITGELPAEVAALLHSDQELADSAASCPATEPEMSPSASVLPAVDTATSASLMPAASANALAESCCAPVAIEPEGAVDEDGIRQEDKEAFLDALAAIRTRPNGLSYDPNVTHWPTLAATLAAVIVAATVFTWLTS